MEIEETLFASKGRLIIHKAQMIENDELLKWMTKPKAVRYCTVKGMYVHVIDIYDAGSDALFVRVLGEFMWKSREPKRYSSLELFSTSASWFSFSVSSRHR